MFVNIIMLQYSIVINLNGTGIYMTHFILEPIYKQALVPCSSSTGVGLAQFVHVLTATKMKQ